MSGSSLVLHSLTILPVVVALLIQAQEIWSIHRKLSLLNFLLKKWCKRSFSTTLSVTIASKYWKWQRAPAVSPWIAKRGILMTHIYINSKTVHWKADGFCLKGSLHVSIFNKVWINSARLIIPEHGQVFTTPCANIGKYVNKPWMAVISYIQIDTKREHLKK